MADGSDRVLHVALTDDALVLHLADGCVLTVPLAWYPRLQRAPASARGNWKIAGNDGDSILWPDIDEVLNVASLLRRDRESSLDGTFPVRPAGGPSSMQHRSYPANGRS